MAMHDVDARFLSISRNIPIIIIIAALFFLVPLPACGENNAATNTVAGQGKAADPVIVAPPVKDVAPPAAKEQPVVAPLAAPAQSASESGAPPNTDPQALKPSDDNAAAPAVVLPPAGAFPIPSSNPKPEPAATPGAAAPLPTPSAPPAAVNPAPEMPAIPAMRGFRDLAGGGRGTVSLNFDDADIYSVIQTVFGEILKVNYIIDARVKGRVTFRSVAPVPRNKVLPLMEVILRLNGVAVIEDSELFRIIPISDLSREPSEIKIGRKIIDSDLKGKAVLQIVPLNYMQSSEIINLINPFISANAVIVDVPKANHIIIADTDANVKRILKLIEYFDKEMKEKKGVRVFVYHVQNTNAKDIAAMLQQIFLDAKPQTSEKTTDATGKTSVVKAPTPAAPIAASKAKTAGSEAIVSDFVKIYADEKLNAIVILGTNEDYDIIKQTVTELDLVPRQVLIEGTIASILLTDNMSLGFAWSLKTTLPGLGLDPVNISFNPTLLDVDPAKATSSGLNLIGVDSSSIVRLAINALASQSKAKLLASPHIMVSDNNEAKIQVGQQVPIPTSETYSTSTGTPTTTIQYKDIGIILKVKPMISDSGLVNLQISQEVSTYSTIELYAEETQIILNKTEAATNLVVKDGHTIVIGGLIREDDSNARSGIPWLSKIPILGYLFGNTSKDNNRTELVILLTPHIVRDAKEAAAVTQKITDKITDKSISETVKKNVHLGTDDPNEKPQTR